MLNLGRVNPTKANIALLNAEKHDRSLSQRLLKCATAQDFIRFAQRKGADTWVCNSNHTAISHNSIRVTVSATLNQPKKNLLKSARKRTIEAFIMMDIAFDDLKVWSDLEIYATIKCILQVQR